MAITIGDVVKINVQSHPHSLEWDAERMWFTVTSVDSQRLIGALSNVPLDMPQLRIGNLLSFSRSDVVEIAWNEDRAAVPPPQPPRRQYWDRCLVDRGVLDDGIHVHFLYREEPNMTEEGDTYPDSGWRIRGDYRGVTDVELGERKVEYVALGAVLNRDDSWVELIDAPVGSRFIRDWERQVFVLDERS